MRLAQDGTLPLSMIAAGRPVKLVSVLAGKKLRHRLAELGLTPGVQLNVMQDQGGPLLVSVYNSRLALGRGMAQKILVQPC